MLYESIDPLAVVDLQACKAAAQTNHEMQIDIDTSASCSLLPHRSDFISYCPIKDMTIGGITANSWIAGVGTITLTNKSTEEIAKESYKATASMSKLNDVVLKRLKMYDLNSWFDSFPIVNTDIGWPADQDQADLFTNLDSLALPTKQEKLYRSIAWINCNIEEQEWTRELSWSKEIILSA